MNPTVKIPERVAAINAQISRYGQAAPGTVQPTPAPVAAPVTSTVSRTPSLLEKAQNEAADTAAMRSAARVEADTYAAQQRQARIDAINTAFAPRIQREKQEGDARLSRVAALNFRSGTVGSGVDATKLGEQKDLNNKAVQALEDEKATLINEAFGWADQLARQRAEDKFSETSSAANANLAKYKERSETAMKALDIFGQQNVTADKLKTVDPKTYETLRDVSGMSDAQIDAYLKTKAPEGVYQWNAAQISGSTMYVPKVVDGKVTMDKVDLGYTPTKEYKTTVKTDEGVLVIYGDGSYDVIGGGSKKSIPGQVTIKEGAPSFEEYLRAADKALHPNKGQLGTSEENWTDLEIETLRKQYNKEFGVTNNSDYTDTEKRRLEQAGLLNASRQEQLDYLYGDDNDIGVDYGQAS